MPSCYTIRIALSDTDIPNILTNHRMDFNRFIPEPEAFENSEERFFWHWEHWGTAENTSHIILKHCKNSLSIIEFPTLWGSPSNELFTKIFAACKHPIAIEYICDDFNGVVTVIQNPDGTVSSIRHPREKSTALFTVLPAHVYYNDPTEGDRGVPVIVSIPDLETIPTVHP